MSCFANTQNLCDTKPCENSSSNGQLAVADDAICDCNLPGIYHCAVPGILARIGNDNKADPDGVERCDSCELYESDKAAVEKLRSLHMLRE